MTPYKFRFRTRSAGLSAEVGGWKNKEEARQCVMCSEGDEESVEHVLLRCAQHNIIDVNEKNCGS